MLMVSHFLVHFFIVVSDPEIKQYIVILNNDLPYDEKFIIKDLGERNLFIKKKAEALVREKMEELMDENTFKVGQRA